MSKYVVGVDFGTLSARALVVEVGTGRELASSAMDYPHGVMDEALPDGAPLMPGWALQHPGDYFTCLSHTVPRALAESGVKPEDVIGLGIDFTACTLMATDGQGTPLCLLPAFAHNPHAWVKLWKHHAAQRYADRINEVAHERREAFLARYGGKTSSEWMLPKIWETLDQAPEVYAAAKSFIDAGDWLVLRLTGAEARSACLAGYKAMWSKREGYPSEDFFRALDPRLARVVDEKLSRDIRPIGSKAGELTPEGASLTGLLPGTAVAVANIDAHVALAPAGITRPGDMMMIMGTSTCHIVLDEAEHLVPGTCGVVEDGVIPGLFGFEAGQCCVGDHFNWFVENCLPEAYAQEARQRGVSPHALLTEKAARRKIGESGLVALDWWNGNRSTLVDADLTGLIMGMTLTTRPEDVFRALMEATAFGTRTIIETFEESGIKVNRLFASGGISKKNPFLMQIYADVCRRPIRVARSTQSPALGSAMFGAVAAGAARGGYDTIDDAAREMGGVDDAVYAPIPENAALYDALYSVYRELYNHYGRGGSDAMKRLIALRNKQASQRQGAEETRPS